MLSDMWEWWQKWCWVMDLNVNVVPGKGWTHQSRLAVSVLQERVHPNSCQQSCNEADLPLQLNFFTCVRQCVDFIVSYIASAYWRMSCCISGFCFSSCAAFVMGIHLVQVCYKFPKQNPQTKIPKQFLAPISTKSKYFQKKILIFVKIIFSSGKTPGSVMVHVCIKMSCWSWCIFSDGCVPSCLLTRSPAPLVLGYFSSYGGGGFLCQGCIWQMQPSGRGQAEEGAESRGYAAAWAQPWACQWFFWVNFSEFFFQGISLSLIPFGMITSISSSDILIFNPAQQDFWLFSCFPHQGVKASSRTACHFLAQNRQF